MDLKCDNNVGPEERTTTLCLWSSSFGSVSHDIRDDADRGDNQNDFEQNQEDGDGEILEHFMPSTCTKQRNVALGQNSGKYCQAMAIAHDLSEVNCWTNPYNHQKIHEQRINKVTEYSSSDNRSFKTIP
jgi:hypothetical protein